MRGRGLRDTRRPSPIRGKFRGSETSRENRLDCTSQTTPISPVRRSQCDSLHFGGHEGDRLRNIPLCDKNVVHGEPASLKFQWNKLLEGKFENAKPVMHYAHDSGGRGYGIDTQNGCQSNGFPVSSVVPRPTYNEYDKLRNCHSSHSTPRGVAGNYRHIDSSFGIPVGKNEVGIQKGSDIPKPWEQQHVAKYSPGGPGPSNNREGQTIPGSRISHGLGMPLSPPKVYPSSIFCNLGVFKDGNIPSCSLGLSRSREMPDGYFAQAPSSNPIEVSKAQLIDLAEYGRVHPRLVEVKDRVSNYYEIRRSEKGDTGVIPNEISYQNTRRFQGNYRQLNSRPPSIVDSIVDRNVGVQISHGEPLRNGALIWERNRSSEEHPTPSYQELTHASNETEYSDELLWSRNTHLEYGTKGYKNDEGWNLNGYERNANTLNYQDQDHWKGLPVLDHDQGIYEQDGSPSGMLTTKYLPMHGLDGEMLGLKHHTDQSQIWKNLEARLSSNQCSSDAIHDLNCEEETLFDEDIIHVQFDDKLPSPYPPMRTHIKSKSRKKIIGKGIKKLPWASWPISIPNSSVSSGRSVHDRLGPRIAPTANTLARKCKKSKALSITIRDFCENAHCPDLPEDKVKPTKADPPEDSKEFKQLVNNAFLKFVKLLNENAAQRRKYTGQGGTGTFKCGICSSKSKEFANTLSLAMHASKSSKAGCRAEHLGFHKALCVLLGWSDTIAPDGLWVQRMLPAAEVLALKNDLIIWPPVVLVHNSSIVHDNPGERTIVSIEELEATLTGMGFGGGKTKVLRGKPANCSVLVVTFSATFSGLQEAERLHKFYADNNHGRPEFEQIGCNGLKNSNEKPQCISGNKESLLYGYQGNAEDLDKLDFESKKHSVVKSKKDIQAIAFAPLLA